MIAPSEMYPNNIHLPTGIFPKSLVDNATPVSAPRGESKSERPRPASVKPSLCLIPGMAATQVPNKRLDAENRKPTASTGLNFMNEEMFFIIKQCRCLFGSATMSLSKQLLRRKG